MTMGSFIVNIKTQIGKPETINNCLRQGHALSTIGIVVKTINKSYTDSSYILIFE